MSIVVDANVIAALVLPMPYSEQATEKVIAWKQADEAMLAPWLLAYEVATALRKAVVAGWMITDTAVEVMHQITAMNIQWATATAQLQEGALRWAERLGQPVAYDACYLALAEAGQVELWTGDRRLAHAANHAGAAWVRWIGESPASAH